jgi:myo-inositol-1(or 4)-monophosphatase
MEPDLQTLCQEVCTLAIGAGTFIRKEREKFSSDRVEMKGKNDLVSYVDKTSEKLIVERLSELLPEAGFIAEEGTSSKTGAVYHWIIDPLDGTTNFVHGMPCYAVSIGLTRNQDLILGVVYEVNFDECFYAWEGSGAYMNGKPIHVSGAGKLADSLLATGFPYYDYHRMPQYMELFGYFMKNTHGLRRLGSAATDLAYVACGRVDGFYEYSLQPWDVAAGAFIVQQAGGKVTDFNGGDNFLFGKEIVAGNDKFFNEFLGAVKKHFS